MSRPMPVSDRMLFMLRARPRTARALSRLTGKGISHVHKILAELEDRDIVEVVDGGAANEYRLADGVDIDYRPHGSDTGEVVVDLDGRDPRDVADEPERCKAITSAGNRCKNNAVEGEYCQLHP